MSKQPSSKRRKMRAERSDHKRESRSNFDDLKCDSCNNTILSANNADHHVRNTPCNHNICMLCVIMTNMRRGCSNTSGCCCQVKSCNKYITSCQYFRAGSPGEVIRNGRGDKHYTMPSFDDLDTDVLANIFGYLLPEDIMRARLNQKMREAAKKTIVPLTEFSIDSVRKYNLMAAMTTALPNYLQQLSIPYVDGRIFRFRDGEDPIKFVSVGHGGHDIDIISRFSKLRILEISSAPLNGRYPALFKFPLLQKLTISNSYSYLKWDSYPYLKWDLEMLEGLPLLKELYCYENLDLTGNLSSLRVLKDTLEEVKMFHCRHVEGDFMDLADFPRLKELDLRGTNVTGHIRDIGEHHFPALEDFYLPGCELLGERIASTAIRNFKHLKISSLGDGHKYSDGEDPDEEEAARTAHYTIHDIDIKSNFTKLRSLEIDSAPLNGRYPALFNFPLLQKLTIQNPYCLKWDLEMLEGLPLLKELHCYVNLDLTGNLSSMRVLKDTLEEVKMFHCRHVEGDFMDLADFPRLKKLDLRGTNVTGHIRDIGEHHFPALENFYLPGCELLGERIASTALRNFKHLKISSLGGGHKYSDGEDPDEEEAARTEHYTIHDIDIISNSTKLRSLEIDSAPLNGRYPALFHKRDSRSNFDDLKCDSCNNTILSANNADHHVQNTPCNHNICMLCVIKTNMRGWSSNQSGCCCQVKSCNKYITSCQYFRAGSPGEVIRNGRGDKHYSMPSFDDLDTDVLAIIFGYLLPEDIMRARLNQKMRDAAKKTIVPLTEFSIPLTAFRIDSVRKYNLMAAMTTALPNLQQLLIRKCSLGHKYSDGEDPDEEETARTAHYTIHDIDIISNFTKLRSLEIWGAAPLNGRYPALFNFPLLQKLKLGSLESSYLRWDLEMLAGLPLLKELDCDENLHLTGNLSSLRVLKDVIEKVKIPWCSSVEGNFMDLADFPRLKELNLRGTNVVADIREVGDRDFLALESFYVPSHKLQRISDAPDLIHTFLPIMRQRPTLLKNWWLELSEGSPDWYYLNEEGDDDRDSEYFNVAPMRINIVQAGPRIGWRWISEDSWGLTDNDTFASLCEVNWLHPEPSRESSDYEKYTKELEKIELKWIIYEGFHEPPTEEQCRRLWVECLSD